MLTFAKVRLQISVPCRNQATSAQLDYLAVLIVKLANAKKIRWAKTSITRYIQMGMGEI